MLKFYYHPSPNPAKVALFLEESGLSYEVVPIDTRKGEQFSQEFTAINPNSKTPALLDDGVPVFDSNAILLYLAHSNRFNLTQLYPNQIIVLVILLDHQRDQIVTGSTNSTNNSAVFILRALLVLLNSGSNQILLP